MCFFLQRMTLHVPAEAEDKGKRQCRQATDGGEGRMVTKVILKFKSNENKLTFV